MLQNYIYSQKCIVDRLISGGSTANVCDIDLSTAFDEVIFHAHALYIKPRNVGQCPT